MSNEYEVGRGKPPKKTQFKKGRSGNPKGRPKGVRNFTTDLKETLKTPVKVMIDGKAKKVSTQKAGLLRLRDQALAKGDGKALVQMLSLAETHNNQELAEDSRAVTPDDAAVLANYKAKLLRRAAKGLERMQPDEGIGESSANSFGRTADGDAPPENNGDGGPNGSETEKGTETSSAAQIARNAAIGEARCRRAFGEPPEEGDEELLREYEIDRALS